ncbi:methyltransferase domain-containing protein [Streptomyces sp. S.PB5]|uniref:methyltransferase domain-containing protein n=1 Tax=Streptomyces sp. S.PB5 TaxID=3020844 RepID=UPI0025B058E1|nr:methyltransferase domain-containing protein [Streptomyces sp. S.PB5]MDN3020755.1 methyltransferase domain-containing protein [Streptomyces sp. S.PB5]
MKRLRTRVNDLDRRRRHRSTARAILRLLPEPESWLDVGTGDARFPETARELFPYTSFDGIDPTPRVEQAREADRVEEAYVGSLTDEQLAKTLRERYDVVTVRRPLDPAGELHAALGVLRSGGYLLLESPEAPSQGLRTELESRGCTVLPAPTRRPHPWTPHRVIARKDPSPA